MRVLPVEEIAMFWVFLCASAAVFAALAGLRQGAIAMSVVSTLAIVLLLIQRASAPLPVSL
jgi:hypothetical protein